MDSLPQYDQGDPKGVCVGLSFEGSSSPHHLCDPRTLGTKIDETTTPPTLVLGENDRVSPYKVLDLNHWVLYCVGINFLDDT